MERVRFEELGPIVASDPNRTDVACFVGFVAPRNVAAPEPIARWLREQGWLPTSLHGGKQPGPFVRASADALRDVPVPIDTWDAFERLFETERRDPDGRTSPGSRFVAAVRSFFAAGGRKCYVVPVGDFASSLAWHRVGVTTEFAADFFAEDFSPPQAASPGSHEAPLAGGWLEPDAASAGSRFVRRGGALRVCTGDGRGIALVERRPVAGDYAIAATVSSANPLVEGGLVARYQDEASYYFASVRPAGLGASVGLWRRLDGVDSELARGAIGDRRGVPLNLELRLAGSALELRVDGERVIAANDGAIPGSGRAGVIGLATGSVASARSGLLALLLPSFWPDGVVERDDPTTWHGLAHVLGLPDVSFVCMPDLPEIVAHPAPAPETVRPEPPPSVRFERCAVERRPAPDRTEVRGRAPRCDAQGFAEWATALQAAASLLARDAREVQLVASIPLPEDGSEPARGLARFLERYLERELDAGGTATSLPVPGAEPVGLASSFLQLAYPWVRSGSARDLPEGLEPPEGLLVGLLARNALQRGTFRSAAAMSIDAIDLVPALTTDERATRVGAEAFEDRISLFGRTPRGFRLLSDVATSRSEAYRQAALGRLIAFVIRAARRAGEDFVFESSGENLWSRVERGLEDVLSRLYAAGALRGEPGRAFQVRCDRSTMSQSDIDAGRTIAVVQLEAALPIDRITVSLALEDGGRVALLGRDPVSEEAA